MRCVLGLHSPTGEIDAAATGDSEMRRPRSTSRRLVPGKL